MAALIDETLSTLWREARLGASLESHSRVDDAVQNIDHDVGDHNEDCGEDRRPHDHGEISTRDGVEREPADTRDVEHSLGDDGAAEKQTQVEAEDGDDRRDGCPHPMPDNDLTLPQALRP